MTKIVIKIKKGKMKRGESDKERSAKEEKWRK